MDAAAGDGEDALRPAEALLTPRRERPYPPRPPVDRVTLADGAAWDGAEDGCWNELNPPLEAPYAGAEEAAVCARRRPLERPEEGP